MKKIAILLLLFTCNQTSAQAQQNGAALFQTFQVDPLVVALGRSTVAIRGYNGAAQINPASIGSSNSIQLGSTFDGSSGFRTPWLPNTFDNFWMASPSIDYATGRWVFAYTYKRLDFGTQEGRDSQNRPTGVFNSFDAAHKVTTAYVLKNGLVVGLSVNAITLKRGFNVEGGASALRTFSLDMGIYYDRLYTLYFGTVLASAGWSLTDFGPPFKDESSPGFELRDPLSMRMRGGVGLLVTSRAEVIGLPAIAIGLYGSLNKNLVYYDEDGEAAGPLAALFSGWKTVTRRTNSDTSEEVSGLQQIGVQGGIEVSLLHVLKLRWGRYQENKVLSDQRYSTFGWGLDFYYLALNYGEIKDDTESALGGSSLWNLTARIPLGRAEGNFWPALIREIVN